MCILAGCMGNIPFSQLCLRSNVAREPAHTYWSGLVLIWKLQQLLPKLKPLHLRSDQLQEALSVFTPLVRSAVVCVILCAVSAALKLKYPHSACFN